MTTWIIIAVGAISVVAVLRLLRTGADMTSFAQHAAHSGNLQLLVEHIESSGPDVASAWDQAIGTLWQAYNRETAAKLVVEAAKRTDAPVVQYWIQRFREVEPDIATEHFSDEFLAEYFRPQVAAKCGRSCGCG